MIGHFQRFGESVLVGYIHHIGIFAHRQSGVVIESHGVVIDRLNSAILLLNGEPVGQGLDGELVAFAAVVDDAHIAIVVVVKLRTIGLP